MATVVLDPYAYEIEQLKQRRRISGLDRFDEVWNGDLHMVPAPSFGHASLEWQLAAIILRLARSAGLEATGQCNIGNGLDDFRVPDGALHRPGASGTWHPTAALVLEIVSPQDESWAKLPFYAAHQVDELLIVDPLKRSVDWLKLVNAEYEPTERSGLIDLGASELAGLLQWP